MKRTRSWLIGVAIGALIAALPATGEDQRKEYHLEAQNLGDALRVVGRRSGREIMFSSDVAEGIRSPRLDGTYTTKEAVERLLSPSGLVAIDRRGSILIRGRSEAAQDAVTDRTVGDGDVIVTGSRIRGTSPASPMIAVSQEQMRDAGQNTLPEVLRSIPQNFSGGQNPGVSIYAPGGGNTTGGSSINLRGLGPDATLTLVNGHRLSYGGQLQAVDISSIPFPAISKVEVVADGASAIYGSDAVAGVANIILRRDYDGAEAGARLGASTDGGNVQQQYNLLVGRKWSSGTVMAAYEFGRNTEIDASQRSYTTGSPGNTLYPRIKRHSVLLTGRQKLTSQLTFEFDAFYNRRWTEQTVVIDGRGNYLLNGAVRSTDSESFAIAPSFKLALGDSWRATLAGLYGEDRANTQQQQFLNNTQTTNTRYCTCNDASSIELGADGPLLHVPAGEVRVAVGLGYRNNTFRMSSSSIDERQNSYFGYGEIDIPIVIPSQQITLIHRLRLSAAGRFERYPNIGQVATPKFGLVYSPTPDIEFKGSWGKSFKAPTLYQMYFVPRAALYPVATLGGAGYPPGSTALMLLGGDTSLQPERATTWSTSVVLHPRAVPGARLELSYFDISYRGRVVTPLTFTNQALSNPIYSDLVTLNPSEAAKAAAVAIQPFFNLTGVAYDSTRVVALVRNTNMNAATQNVRGVDVAATYDIDLHEHGALTLSGYGSYIDSDRRLSRLQPLTPLAGTIFNPPHFRGRAGASWVTQQLTLASFVNHIGSVRDVRTSADARLDSMTTWDITGRIKAGDSGPVGRLEIAISIQNLLNVKPSPVPNYAFTAPPFDSTNYSPIGRFVSFGITKRF